MANPSGMQPGAARCSHAGNRVLVEPLGEGGRDIVRQRYALGRVGRQRANYHLHRLALQLARAQQPLPVHIEHRQAGSETLRDGVGHGRHEYGDDRSSASRTQHRENCLEPLGLSVTEAARVLDVARHTLSWVLNGHAASSVEMALRLEKAGSSNAEFWLRRQTTYDLVQARKDQERIHVQRYRPQPAV